MAPETPRLVGVDLARGLAVIGMFVAHAIPRADESELLADGRSSMLFATLAGISLGIMTGRDRPLARGARSDRVVGILLRAVLLFLLGVALSSLGSGIAIILDYYAVMFVLLVPLLFAPRRVLAGVALASVVGMPVIASAVAASPAPPGTLRDLAAEYLLTGYYPALPWLFLLLGGLVAARSGLHRPRTQVGMMSAGAALSVLGYGAAALLPGVSAEAHSDSTAELLGSGGLALVVTGALLWLTSPDRGAAGRGIRTALSPLEATGSMALSVYTLQILALALVSDLAESGADIDYPGWPLLIGLIAGALVFATLWRRFLGRGPLERLLTALTRPGSAPAVRDKNNA